MELARRRGGGGAVYLGPGEQLWLDAWMPRDDPLWVADVSAAAEWVGAWWTEALAGSGSTASTSTAAARCRGSSVTWCCFAGRGPGEVFHGWRKVVGLSQWRAREGALFSSCAYLRWDPVPLLALVDFEDDGGPVVLAQDLAPLALGLAELEPPVADLSAVRDRLLDSLPEFGVTPASGGGARPAPGLTSPGSSAASSASSPPSFLCPSSLFSSFFSRSAPSRWVAPAGRRTALVEGRGEPLRGSFRTRSMRVGGPWGFQLRCSGSKWLCEWWERV